MFDAGIINLPAFSENSFWFFSVGSDVHRPLGVRHDWRTEHGVSSLAELFDICIWDGGLYGAPRVWHIPLPGQAQRDAAVGGARLTRGREKLFYFLERLDDRVHGRCGNGHRRLSVAARSESGRAAPRRRSRDPLYALRRT